MSKQTRDEASRQRDKAATQEVTPETAVVRPSRKSSSDEAVTIGVQAYPLHGGANTDRDSER